MTNMVEMVEAFMRKNKDPRGLIDPTLIIIVRLKENL